MYLKIDKIHVRTIFLGELSDAIAEAITLSKNHGGCLIEFEFNDVTINIDSSSNPTTIRRDYFRALYHLMDGVIGPHPQPVLGEDETAAYRALANKELVPPLV